MGREGGVREWEQEERREGKLLFVWKINKKN